MSTLAEQLVQTEAHKSIFESAVRQLPLPVCAAFGSSRNPQPVTLTQWATFTVRLVWESSDWKIDDVTVSSGPTPDTAIATGDQTPLPGVITVFTG